MTATTLTPRTVDPLSVESQVRELADACTDAKADTRLLTVEPLQDATVPEQRIAVVFNPPGHDAVALTPRHRAHAQLADKLGVPMRYYQRMLEDAPDLLATNLNHWMEAEPKTRLLRLIAARTEDEREALQSIGTHGYLRAFLGDRFTRELDNLPVLNTLLPVIYESGDIARFSLDEDNFRLNVVRPGTVEVPRVGEIIRTGFEVWNAETGGTALAFELYCEVLRCTNGMVSVSKERFVHVGRKGNGNDGYLSAEAQTADHAATLLRLRDKAVDTLQEAHSNQWVEAVGRAADVEFSLDVPQFEFLAAIGDAKGLVEAEVEVLKEEVAREQARREGDFLSGWQLTQGITAMARRSATFQRRRELEQVGWEVLGDPASLLAKNMGKVIDRSKETR